MGAAPGCSGVIRLTLVFLNLTMMLVALAVLALVLWIRLDPSFEYEMRNNILLKTDSSSLREEKQDIRVAITVVFWVLIGFSSACAIIGLTGMLGSAARSRPVMGFYCIQMVILIILEIAVGIYVLIQRKDISSTVKQYVETSYSLNSVDVKTFEYRYDCCGYENGLNGSCMAGKPTCTAAIWDRLDYTMMVFGSSMIIVVVLQIVTAIFGFVLTAKPSRYANACPYAQISIPVPYPNRHSHKNDWLDDC